MKERSLGQSREKKKKVPWVWKSEDNRRRGKGLYSYLQAPSSSSASPATPRPKCKESNGKRWMAPQNKDAVNFPELLLRQYHFLSAYTVPGTVAKLGKQNPGFPSGARLDGWPEDSANPEVCWEAQRPPEAVKTESECGICQRGGARRGVQNHRQRSLCIPPHLHKSSFSQRHSHRLLCGHHGIVLTIKIISVYSKKNFFKKEWCK